MKSYSLSNGRLLLPLERKCVKCSMTDKTKGEHFERDVIFLRKHTISQLWLEGLFTSVIQNKNKSTPWRLFFLRMVRKSESWDLKHTAQSRHTHELKQSKCILFFVQKYFKTKTSQLGCVRSLVIKGDDCRKRCTLHLPLRLSWVSL